MEISELTKRMHDFVDSKGWYQPDSPRPQTPKNLAISLCVETAELLEIFQWSPEGEKTDALSEELADIALYLLQIASITGVDLEQAILSKLRENADRNW
jgi:NTP pyrophosphatase (non-canonical NTP hydrolase)